MKEKKPITERIIQHLGKAALSVILLPISAIITALVVTAAAYLMPTLFTGYGNSNVLLFLVPWIIIYAILLNIFGLTKFAKGLSTFILIRWLIFALVSAALFVALAMYTMPTLFEKNENIKVIIFLIAFALFARIFIEIKVRKSKS